MEVTSTTINACLRAKAASRRISTYTDEQINRALLSIAAELRRSTPQILKANERDVEAARGTLPDVMIDRLLLTESRIESMAKGIEEISLLPSPLGEVLEERERPNGLNIKKISVPMGVIAIIYESRPNVTSDAAALALKSGNACVLRGGKEAFNSSFAIVEAIRRGLSGAGLDPDAVNIVTDTTRASAGELMRASGLVDLLIPRGGKGLIKACVEGATVPCLETGTGICHIYVDESADIDKALNIIENAKTSRPSVCNAAEVLLADRKIADKLLPLVKERLVERRIAQGLTPVELRLDKEAMDIIDGTTAGEEDFDTEFLDYIMAVKVVDGVSEAVLHIADHSTHHSEAIIAESPLAQRIFTDGVDSAAVYVNASTRFTDGGEFGLGCEMGISTQKMHARGPLGIRELTTYKYVITGNGQIR